MEKGFNSIEVMDTKESILDNPEKQITLFRKLESVYSQRPDIETFEGAMSESKDAAKYTKEAIGKDVAYVEDTRRKIDEKNSSHGRQILDRNEMGFQLSEILQAMIVDRMNHHWFKDVKAIMTSDFDDLRVGIDAVLKHKDGGYLGTAFDFTVSSQESVIEKKLVREWERNIKTGKIPTIKYFEDPDTHQKGSLLVPKFIVGASKKDVEDLAAAYIEDNQDVLENHPFKYLILQQIEEQLQTILDYYETNDLPQLSFAKKKYEQIQSLLRGMKKDIHADEHMTVDLHEYSKKSVALDTMRRFRIMREKGVVFEDVSDDEIGE
jgi:hypothetical protein